MKDFEALNKAIAAFSAEKLEFVQQISSLMSIPPAKVSKAANLAQQYAALYNQVSMVQYDEDSNLVDVTDKFEGRLSIPDSSIAAVAEAMNTFNSRIDGLVNYLNSYETVYSQRKAAQQKFISGSFTAAFDEETQSFTDVSADATVYPANNMFLSSKKTDGTGLSITIGTSSPVPVAAGVTMAPIGATKQLCFVAMDNATKGSLYGWALYLINKSSNTVQLVAHDENTAKMWNENPMIQYVLFQDYFLTVSNARSVFNACLNTSVMVPTWGSTNPFLGGTGQVGVSLIVSDETAEVKLGDVIRDLLPSTTDVEEAIKSLL